LGTVAQAIGSDISFSPGDRVLVLAPHPDDDILGCAGIIQKALKEKVPVHVTYMTYGDNYEWAFWMYKKYPILTPEGMRKMGMLRHGEAIAAQAVLGLSRENLTFLGYPDWGTEQIWMNHWGDARPAFRSMLTRVTAVPYSNALRPGAAYKGENVLADLESVLREFRPTKVFVSHPADAHRDHRTLYLFAQVALWNVSAEIKPEIFPYIVHHPRWPLPRGFKADRELDPPKELASLSWVFSMLNDDQVELKQTAIQKHRTQMSKDAAYLYAFVASNELFSPPDELSLGEDLPNPTEEMGENTEPDIAWRSLDRQGDQLVLRVALPRAFLKPDQKAHLYLFGYRFDRPFAEMPKLSLSFSARSVKVFDQSRALDVSHIQIQRKGREVTLAIPLKLFGDPQKILGTAWSKTGEGPFEWRAWRIIDLGGKDHA
jgi:LmbE family N-acetylglucosaminyl deacetylase